MELNEEESRVAVAALDQYVRLLEDDLDDAGVEDLVLSPEQKARQAELTRATKLRDRLAASA